MKPINRFTPKYALTTVIGCLTFLGLVSWSPPSNDDVLVTSGDIIIRDGILEVKAGNGVDNTFSTAPAPALILGNSNNIVRGAGNTELGRGLVIGTANTLSTAGSYSGVIGSLNDIWAAHSLVVGSDNDVSIDATDWDSSTRYSVISGFQNVITPNCNSLLVGGRANTVTANTSLVIGHTNTVVGPAAIGSSASHSAAIGQLNHIASSFGWTMGYFNMVTGSRGVAIGSGLTASNTQSTALGRFNSPMQSNDVLVVGTGSAASANTALRVTNNGGVILGRAQGDISMGIYGN